MRIVRCIRTSDRSRSEFLNLMPLKEETELQLLRSLSNTPLQVDVTFVAVSSHGVQEYVDESSE